VSPQPAPAANTVTVSGPSLVGEGLTRAMISSARRAIAQLAGAADVLRSLNR
jgi:hypothetical protein